jgi:hypothetical protein
MPLVDPPSLDVHVGGAAREPAARPYERLFVLGATYHLACEAGTAEAWPWPAIWKPTAAASGQDCRVDEVRPLGRAVFARHTCGARHDWYAMTDDGMFAIDHGVTALQRAHPLIAASPVEGSWLDAAESDRLGMRIAVDSGADGTHWCASRVREANARAWIEMLCVDKHAGIVGTWVGQFNAEADRWTGTRCGDALPFPH